MIDDLILYGVIAAASFIILWGPQSLKIFFASLFQGEGKIVKNEVYEADEQKPSFYDVPNLGLVPFVRMEKVRTEQIGDESHTLFDYIFQHGGKEIRLPYWNDDWKEDNPHTSGSRLFRIRNKGDEYYKQTIQHLQARDAQKEDELDQFSKTRMHMEEEYSEHYGRMIKNLRPPMYFDKNKKKGGEQQEGGMEGGEYGE